MENYSPEDRMILPYPNTLVIQTEVDYELGLYRRISKTKFP